MFKQVRAQRRWVIGSLVSDTGSEYLFGFDPNQGLMWLERPGHEYSSADAVWKEAESFVTAQLAPERDIREELVTERALPELQEAETVTRSIGQPQQVQRSSAATDGWDDPYPMEGDPRIVGDTSASGRDVPDEDIAAQAAQFLMEHGGEE